MILPDVNVLVYAFREEAVNHDRYKRWLEGVLATEEVAVVDHCLVGFVRVVTNPRIFSDPAPTALALEFVERLRRSGRARPTSATSATWALMNDWAGQDSAVRGNLVPDSYLAALAVAHGASIATNDRGFARFPGVDLIDPLRSDR